ncbi:hypothetical protein HDU67_007180, partial [Dinochytrium kinnereticum]
PYGTSHHRISDQKRREDLKTCFDNLLTLLPPPALPVPIKVASAPSSGADEADEEVGVGRKSGAASKPPNRVEIMGRTLDYIIYMKGRVKGLDGKIEGLKAELGRLRAERGITVGGGVGVCTLPVATLEGGIADN